MLYSDHAILSHQLLPNPPQLPNSKTFLSFFPKSSNNKTNVNKKHTQNEKTQKWKTEYKNKTSIRRITFQKWNGIQTV